VAAGRREAIHYFPDDDHWLSLESADRRNGLLLRA
jgi:hypothetical protein